MNISVALATPVYQTPNDYVKLNRLLQQEKYNLQRLPGALEEALALAKDHEDRHRFTSYRTAFFEAFVGKKSYNRAGCSYFTDSSQPFRISLLGPTKRSIRRFAPPEKDWRLRRATPEEIRRALFMLHAFDEQGQTVWVLILLESPEYR